MSRAGSLNTFRNKKQYFVNCTQISLLNIIINIFEYMLDAFESSLPDFCHKNVKRLFQYYRFPSRRFSASEGTRGYLCRNKDKKLLYREPVQQPLRFTAYYLYLTISAGTSAAEMNRIHFAMPTSSQMSGICTAPKEKLLSR